MHVKLNNTALADVFKKENSVKRKYGHYSSYNSNMFVYFKYQKDESFQASTA